MLQALAVPHHIDQHELRVTGSIGIVVYPDDGADADMLLKHADIAMYHAKDQGRNNYQFFEPDLNVRALERQVLESGLRRAIEGHELVLHYQPKMDLESGAIVGAEAFVRWRHPERGLILPATVCADRGSVRQHHPHRPLGVTGGLPPGVRLAGRRARVVESGHQRVAV